MTHEFTRIIDVYDLVSTEVTDEDGNKKTITEEKCIKKDITFKWFVRNLEDIISYEQFLDKDGNVVEDLSVVEHKSKGPVIIKCPYEELKQLLEEDKKSKVHGFKKK